MMMLMMMTKMPKNLVFLGMADTDDGLPPLLDFKKERFGQGKAYLIIGPSGTGKSTFLEESLKFPRKYFDFSTLPLSTHLYIFRGASNVLEENLKPHLINSPVFKRVFWPNVKLEQCTQLIESLEKSKGRRRHIVILDDYKANSGKEAVLVERLLTHYKRHEHLTLIILSHNFRKNAVNYTIADNSDRIYFTRSMRNRMNLRSFARRLSVPQEAQEQAIREMTEEPVHGVACYCSETSLFIPDYRNIELKQVTPVIGKWYSSKLFLYRFIIFSFFRLWILRWNELLSG